MTVEPTIGPKPLRRDAQARRDRLIEAAAECFDAHGFNVPLEEIMARAEVGRGTFYRNFKDRIALVHAIFEREVEKLGPGFDPDRSLAETLTALVIQGAEANRLFLRLSTDMALHGEDLAAFQALGTRFEELLAPAIEGARARGEIDPALGGRQLALALRMLGSLLHPASDEAVSRAELAEGVDLILHGLRPR